MDDKTYDILLERLRDEHKYDLKGIRKVPQVWTKEERSKRNLEKEISDEYLVEKEQT